MTAERKPGFAEIEARFVGLLDGSMSRDEVDRWAGRWYFDDDLEWDELSSWALELLSGIDLRQYDEHGAPGDHFEPDESVAELLEELRRRRAASSAPPRSE